MDFQTLQIRFANKHLDNRTEWLSLWTANLEAVNVWYKAVFNLAIQDRSIEEIMKSFKTNLTFTNAIAILPVDFKQPVKLYFRSSGSFVEVDKAEYPYRYIRDNWVNKIQFEINPPFPVQIEYIKIVVDLVNIWDTPVLPTEFDRDIINYALVEYHTLQRDWAEVSNSLQFAEWQLKETIDSFWLE